MKVIQDRERASMEKEAKVDLIILGTKHLVYKLLQLKAENELLGETVKQLKVQLKCSQDAQQLQVIVLL
jgi:hypothetical protein